MALNHPGTTVEAITVVAGNVSLEQGVQNALYTLELCGSDAPVHRGASSPLLVPLVTAQEVHGKDGMGDIGLPLSGREPEPGHAVDVLVDAINASPGGLTLVALGPLTNVALALLKDQSIAGKVRDCVVMGGTGRGPGNVTPVAEYNIWADPEAASIVFESGMPLTMVGWDVSYGHAVFDAEDSARLRAIGTPLAEFCVDIQAVLDAWAKENTHLAGFDLPDPITMAVALDPAVVTETRRLFVAVETGGVWSRGQTIVDHLGVAGREPNIAVVMEASRERFLDLLHAAVT